MEKSALQIARAAYQPKLPRGLQGAVKVQEGAPTQSVDNQEEIKALFPNTYGMPLVEFVAGEAKSFEPMNVGIILSGGQAPGGHNVITGLFDTVKKLNPANRLFGFILGPGGLVDHNYMELTADIIDEYRNTGGFDMIGSGRTKLETEEQFEELAQFVKDMKFQRMGCFPYSQEENTPAAKLPDQIDGDVKQKRAEIICDNQQLIMEEYAEKMIGSEVEVLVEGFDRYAECYFGRTAGDCPEVDGNVFFTTSGEKPREGTFVKVKITDSLGIDPVGEVITN